MAIIDYYGMHEKVRHRMTSLFSVCPPITCIIGLIVKCAWIGTSDIRLCPFLMMSNLWYFLYLWLFDSVSLKKDLFFQRAHVQSTRRSNQEKTRPPTRWTSDPIKTNTAPQFSVTSKKSLSPMIQTFMFFWIFFLKKFLWFSIFSIFNILNFMRWERDSASAKIDDCNWWWLI